MSALFGFAERQLYVYKRYWVWEFVWLFYSIVSVLSIGFLASGLGALGAGPVGFDLRRGPPHPLRGAPPWGLLLPLVLGAAYAIALGRRAGTTREPVMVP